MTPFISSWVGSPKTSTVYLRFMKYYANFNCGEKTTKRYLPVSSEERDRVLGQFNFVSMREDIDYVVKTGQTKSDGGTLYSDAVVYDEELLTDRSIVNEDAVLGISRDQYDKVVV